MSILLDSCVLASKELSLPYQAGRNLRGILVVGLPAKNCWHFCDFVHLGVIVVYFNAHSYLNRLKKKEKKDILGSMMLKNSYSNYTALMFVTTPCGVLMKALKDLRDLLALVFQRLKKCRLLLFLKIRCASLNTLWVCLSPSQS